MNMNELKTHIENQLAENTEQRHAQWEERISAATQQTEYMLIVHLLVLEGLAREASDFPKRVSLAKSEGLEVTAVRGDDGWRIELKDSLKVHYNGTQEAPIPMDFLRGFTLPDLLKNVAVQCKMPTTPEFIEALLEKSGWKGMTPKRLYETLLRDAHVLPERALASSVIGIGRIFIFAGLKPNANAIANWMRAGMELGKVEQAYKAVESMMKPVNLDNLVKSFEMSTGCRARDVLRSLMEGELPQDFKERIAQSDLLCRTAVYRDTAGGDLVRTLIKGGADINRPNELGHLPLDLALSKFADNRRQHLDFSLGIITALVEAGAGSEPVTPERSAKQIAVDLAFPKVGLQAQKEPTASVFPASP